ncbi:TrgA family protein [Leisingera sp. SS27]|uniref:TrgA family protein n=1 Tax=Leisingera sp. SS27 TaxID=2979462 RepID=UPI0017B395ED|nr:TrgA family protein [Leisingera sp. SS27]MDC0656852.1 TrgA family protein [Leisingera sp. SS27]NVK16791.1 TrgA family protein [Paracoccaceae bacterium]
MPTGARLAAAISLATLAFIVSFLVMPLLPEGTNFGYFVHINVVLGLLCGWIFMGKRAGRGVVPAINNGLTGMAVLVLWALFVQGAWEMFRLAMRHRYGGPFEALSQIFVIGMEYFFLIAVPSVLIPLVVGGALAGLVTENASQRWR